MDFGFEFGFGFEITNHGMLMYEDERAIVDEHLSETIQPVERAELMSKRMENEAKSH